MAELCHIPPFLAKPRQTPPPPFPAVVTLLIDLKLLTQKSLTMQKIKTANIILIIAVVILIVGFVLVITRKQSLNSTTGELKSFWGKPKTDAPAAA